MSPTKKPGSIAGLRRGIGTAPAEIERQRGAQFPEPARPSNRGKPVRITLNLPPELFRQLDHWTRDAADTAGVPRIGVQDALRAMIAIMTGDEAPNTTARIIAQIRHDG